MNLHEALAKLAPTKADGFITRGGTKVRNAMGAGEQALHRYVTVSDPVQPFDASDEDLFATDEEGKKTLRDDWKLGSFEAERKRLESRSAPEGESRGRPGR